MANKDLIDKKFTIPDNVIHDIKMALKRYPDASGHERAKHLVSNPVITYQNVKRIKTFLDQNINAGTPSYALCGGKLMLSFIDKALSLERENLKRTKTIKTNAGFNNQFIKSHDKNFLKQSIPRARDLKLPKVKRMELFEQENISDCAFCLAIVVNNEKKILLAKRADDDDWMPGKWALLGGGIEPGEDPFETVARELKEEANIDLVNIEFCSSVTEEDNKKGIIFIAKCMNENLLQLNAEHCDSIWISADKIQFLDTVPDLDNNIKKALLAYQQKTSS